MKFKIKHEIKGRIRVRAIMKHMTAKEADLLEYALSNKEGITSVRVNERTLMWSFAIRLTEQQFFPI